MILWPWKLQENATRKERELAKANACNRLWNMLPCNMDQDNLRDLDSVITKQPCENLSETLQQQWEQNKWKMF